MMSPQAHSNTAIGQMEPSFAVKSRVMVRGNIGPKTSSCHDRVVRQVVAKSCVVAAFVQDPHARDLWFRCYFGVVAVVASASAIVVFVFVICLVVEVVCVCCGRRFCC